MSEARKIDGKAVSARLRGNIGEKVTRLRGTHSVQPGLAVVLVGEDPASQVYVRNKVRQTEEVGMRSLEFRLPSDTSEETLLEKVRELNADDEVDGILVQFPVPEQIRQSRVIETILPEKDVDGLHPLNMGRLAGGMDGMVPCTPLGCRILARDAVNENGGKMQGLHAVIVGRSNLVGKPVAQLLLADHCTVTIAHSRTRDLPQVCLGADVLVAAVGRAEMVRGDWVKPGAVVIDVGINRTEGEDGKSRLVGDVAFDECSHAGAITPVPGGVGPMTIACLLGNTLTAACRRRGLPEMEWS